MLVIRKPQLDEPDAGAHRHFLLRVVHPVRADLEVQSKRFNVEPLPAPLRESEKRDQAYSIRGETGTMHFFDLEFLSEPRFEFAPKQAWLRRLLQETNLPPDSRLSLIDHRLNAMASSAAPSA